MSQFIATLESPITNRSALALGDTNDGIFQINILNPTPLAPKSRLRGLSIQKDRLFLATSTSIQIYKITKTSHSLSFNLQKEIFRPEWIIDNGTQTNSVLDSNIYALLFSEKRNRIYISNNRFFSVDEFSSDGDFIRSRHLWDIAPEIFKLPQEIRPGFNYGVIYNINEADDGSILLTVAFCNNTDEGKVINMDTGQSILCGLQPSWGGEIRGSQCYIINAVLGTLSSFRYNRMATGHDPVEPDWVSKPAISAPKYKKSTQQMRGLTLINNVLYAGVCHFRDPAEKQIPPRIVAFVKETGKQINEIELPDLVEFRQPRIFFIKKLPPSLHIDKHRKLSFFLHGKLIKSKPYKEVELTKIDLFGKKYCLVSLEVPRNILTPFYCLAPTPVKKITSITLEHVSLCYRRSSYSFWSRKKQLRENRNYWAIRDLSFTFYEGDTIGLIGRNGSGKSTASMMISGALKPDKGKVITHGKVQLLALGIGFRPQLTGRENVLISGTILGMPRKEVKARMDEIEEFAELGDFFDEPIRTYSAGMKSRLGFAVSTAVQPDILILDEVMSTGDAAFRNKANKRMMDMRERTKTVIFVSHSPAQIRELCSRVVWLEQGRLLMDGSIEEILPIYERFCNNPDKWLTDHPETADVLTQFYPDAIKTKNYCHSHRLQY